MRPGLVMGGRSNTTAASNAAPNTTTKAAVGAPSAKGLLFSQR